MHSVMKTKPLLHHCSSCFSVINLSSLIALLNQVLSCTFVVFMLCVCCREPFIILSGGLSFDTVGRLPCLTVMHGKSTAVLEMDYPIVDFLTLCETPYSNGMCSCVSVPPLSAKTLYAQTFCIFNYIALLGPRIFRL